MKAHDMGATTVAQAETAQADAWQGSRARWRIVLAACALSLAALAAANLCAGSAQMSLPELMDALAQGPGGSSMQASVIWQIRLPRAASAALLGGALAVSGFLLQTFFNNPIASPYILGISSGAKCALAAVMICVVGAGGALVSWQVVGAAFLGSLAATALVLALSRKIRSMAMLIVAGVMVGYVFSAITDFLVTFASDANIVNLHNWALGSFSGANWGEVAMEAGVCALGLAASMALAKPMAAYQLGEGYARSVGVRTNLFRAALIGVSSLLSACVTAFAGPVGFVGIAVPFLARTALGSSKPSRVVPVCFILGAAFCLLCDLVARCAFSPTELNLSTVTAVFGAPVVLALMLGRRREGR